MKERQVGTYGEKREACVYSHARQSLDKHGHTYSVTLPTHPQSPPTLAHIYLHEDITHTHRPLETPFLPTISPILTLHKLLLKETQKDNFPLKEMLTWGGRRVLISES
jgi:hypothetical protein